MGHVMSTGLELLGTATSPRLNQRLASAVKKTVELADSQNLTPREKLHVKALELLSHGWAFEKSGDEDQAGSLGI